MRLLLCPARNKTLQLHLRLESREESMELLKSTSDINLLGHLVTSSALVLVTSLGIFSLQVKAVTVKSFAGLKTTKIQTSQRITLDSRLDLKQPSKQVRLLAQTVGSGIPNITATQMYDNFESYGNTLPVTNWPTPGGYMINPWGDPNAGLFPSLSADYKADGNYSMKLGYNIEATRGYAGTGHLLTDAPDWSPWDGVQFWIKPDGSGRNGTKLSRISNF